MSDKTPPENIKNTALILSNEEAIKVIKELENNPFDTPKIFHYSPDVEGIMWIDVKAFGLASIYKDISCKDIAEKAQHIIESYFIETRGYAPDIFIKIAEPNRLYFAIPLSEAGSNYLQKQEQNRDNSNCTIKKSVPLEEEVINLQGEQSMIIGYRKSDYEEIGIKVPISITLAQKESSILIAGKSGSGKSLSARWYLFNMLRTKESLVFISDYKAGEEYETLEGSHSYSSGSESIQLIERFYQFFTEVRKQRLRLKKHYTLYVEEWFGLLTFAETQDKKLRAELMAKVGEILAVGRGLNIGVMLCVQRADAQLFTSGSREQFQVIISFGRCSSEQFRMLGFSGEMEENPTGSFGAGQGMALIDGQGEVQEIIVPWIRNTDVMCYEIRHYLDMQPELSELTRAVAGGVSEGL